MIDRLDGTILARAASRIVVGVGGVGFGVNVPGRNSNSLHVGDTVSLFTVMIVREDDISLYGFLDEPSKTTFDILRGVNGVGPKLALAVLSDLSVQVIAQAVANEDFATFKAVSGVGPKTAKLMTVSLAGRLDAVVGAVPTASNGDGSTTEHLAMDTVVQGLVGLGWDERQALTAVRSVVEDQPSANESTVLREALRILGSNL